MNIAICDDNLMEQQECAHQVMELAKKYNIEVQLSYYASGEELCFGWQEDKESIDIIYLDIKMGGMTGVDTATKLREIGCKSEIIFFTVSKDFYMAAFDVNALHYIIKGETSESKFEEIFARATTTVREQNRQYLLCSGAGESRYIDVETIKYFKVDKRIITIYYDESQTFSFYSAIGKIANQLSECGFIRIHRNYLVAVSYVDVVHHQDIYLRDGTKLAVGRAYYPEVKRMVELGLINKSAI